MTAITTIAVDNLQGNGQEVRDYVKTIWDKLPIPVKESVEIGMQCKRSGGEAIVTGLLKRFPESQRKLMGIRVTGTDAEGYWEFDSNLIEVAEMTRKRKGGVA